MAFLNIDLDFLDHPKTTQLVGLLGPGSELLPLRLWIYAGKFHSADGRLEGYTAAAVEQVLRWTGEGGAAVKALELCGFLETDKNGFKIHDWKAHQGHIHALKMRNKKIARNRWKKIKKGGVSVDTSGIPKSTTRIPRPTDQPTNKPTNHLLSIKEKEISISNGSDISKTPPPPLSGVVDEILEDLKEEKSRKFFEKAEEAMGEGELRELFGEMKMRRREGMVTSPAAYLVALVKKRSDELVRAGHGRN